MAKKCLKCNASINEKAHECPFCGSSRFEMNVPLNEKTEAKTASPKSEIYSEKIRYLMDLALADGELTEKEKQILFKNAEMDGIDIDEFEMVLNAKLQEKQQRMKTAKEEIPIVATPKSDKFGDIRKCPACGALVSSFSAKCSDCGHEFSNVNVSKNVEKFFEKLDELEQQRIEITSTPDDIEYEQLKALDKRKEEMILSFPIPIQKSEIIEFLTHASSRIDEGLSKWNNVWIKKVDQIYSKASFSMKDDKKTMEAMKALVDEAHAKVSKGEKKKTIIIAVGIVVALIIIGLIVFIDGKATKVGKYLQAGEFEKAKMVYSTISVGTGAQGEVDLRKKTAVGEQIDDAIESHIDMLIKDGNFEEARKIASFGTERVQQFIDKILLAEILPKFEKFEDLLIEKNYDKLQLELGKLTWTGSESGKHLFLEKKKNIFDLMPKKYQYSNDVERHFGTRR